MEQQEQAQQVTQGQATQEQATQQGQQPQLSDQDVASAFLAQVEGTQQQPQPEAKQEGQEEGKEAKEPEKDVGSLLERDAEESRRKREFASIKQRALEEIKTKAQSDRVSLLKELGIDPADLVVEYLSGSTQEPGTEPRKQEDEGESDPKTAALEQKLAQLEQQLQQRQLSESRQAAISNTKKFLEENKERYALLSGYEGSSEIVLQALSAKYNQDREYYDTHNTVPTFDDVAGAVEEYAENNCKQQLQWMAKQPKLRQAFLDAVKIVQGGEEPQGQQDFPDQQAASKKPTYIISEMASESPGFVEPGDMDEDERIKLAIEQVRRIQQGG